MECCFVSCSGNSLGTVSYPFQEKLLVYSTVQADVVLRFYFILFHRSYQFLRVIQFKLKIPVPVWPTMLSWIKSGLHLNGWLLRNTCHFHHPMSLYHDWKNMIRKQLVVPENIPPTRYHLFFWHFFSRFWKTKESKTIEKYIEIKRMWNMNVTVIPVIIRTPGTVSKRYLGS